jgi:hypothetical protein
MVQEPKPFIANLQPKMFRSNLTYMYIYICIYIIYTYIYILQIFAEDSSINSISPRATRSTQFILKHPEQRNRGFDAPEKKQCNSHWKILIPFLCLNSWTWKTLRNHSPNIFPCFFPLLTTNKKPSSTVIKCDSLVDQPLWSTMNLLWTTYVPLLTTYFPRF